MKRILASAISLIAMTAGMARGGDILEETPRPAPKRLRERWASEGSSPANKRAAERLEAHRKIWDNTPSADKMTRSRRRRAAMGKV